VSDCCKCHDRTLTARLHTFNAVHHTQKNTANKPTPPSTKAPSLSLPLIN
jgi:hypothetical protein